MAGNILWQSGTVISFAPQTSGQGAQLTNGSRVFASGDVYNNGASGGPCLFGMFTLICAASGFGANVMANQGIDLFLLPAADGTNPITGATSGLPPTMLRGSFVTPISGNTPRMAMGVEGVPLLPVRYRVWIQNNTGQTLTSGWSLFFDGYNGAYT